MNTLKHTRCSHCGWTRKCHSLELVWRTDCSGPWLWLGGWFCISCRGALAAFISSFDLVEDAEAAQPGGVLSVGAEENGSRTAPPSYSPRRRQRKLDLYR